MLMRIGVTDAKSALSYARRMFLNSQTKHILHVLKIVWDAEHVKLFANQKPL